ncbi:MAG: type transport system ATP-binding protein [Frankiaceae bacterium]|jgi:ABC-type multidrug transport system ATPase subunit|nr:type transport system ATP-binding protein [Frankiaceae bacterium]
MTSPPTGLGLRIERVSRRFGERVALQQLSLAIAPGAAVALMGPNGSGKTTLLRLISGRDVPSTGQVLLDGRTFTEDDEWVRRAVAVVAEDAAFYPDLTVFEHVWLVAAAHGAGQQSSMLVETALAAFRLDDHAGALPRELSSGQQQALLLATALVRPRRMLVLDEPERRLDPDARDRLAGLLNDERSAGVTIVMATHHRELADAVADHVVLLREGHQVAAGPPSDVSDIET